MRLKDKVFVLKVMVNSKKTVKVVDEKVEKNVKKSTRKAKFIVMDVKNRSGKTVNTIKVDQKFYDHVKENDYKIHASEKYFQISVNGKTMKLHRYIFYEFDKGIPSKGQPKVDHKFSNTSDNRISMLRQATAAQNARNRKKKEGASSKYYGVLKSDNSWRVRFEINGVIYSRRYKDELHAAYHYDLIIKEHKMEEFTPINKIRKPKDFVLKPFDYPPGIGKDKDGTFYFYFHGRRIRGHDSVENAMAERILKLAKEKADLKIKIMSEPIIRNSDNVPIIAVFNGLDKSFYNVTVNEHHYYNLKMFKWCKNDDGYPASKGENRKVLLMHRYVMNCKKSDEFVDHVHGELDDVRVENLRIVPCELNNQNITISPFQKYVKR